MADIYEPEEGDFLVQSLLSITGSLATREGFEGAPPTIPAIVLEFEVINHEEQQSILKIHIHDDACDLKDLNNLMAMAIAATYNEAEKEIPKNN